MLDWMFSVLKAFKVSTDKTYHLCVHLMDTYLIECYKLKKKFKKNSLLLLGLTCISIATKSEDVYFIPLDMLEEKAAFGKFTEKQIGRNEFIVLNTIKFRTHIKTLFDHIFEALHLYQLTNEKLE